MPTNSNANEPTSALLDSLDAFHVTVSGVWSAVIGGRLPDDDGWAAIGDALAELREETRQP